MDQNIQQRKTDISMYKVKYVPNCLRLVFNCMLRAPNYINFYHMQPLIYFRSINVCLHVLCLTKKIYMCIIICGACFSSLWMYIPIYSDFLRDICSLRYTNMYIYTIGLLLNSRFQIYCGHYAWPCYDQ